MIVRCSKCHGVLYDDGEKIPTLLLACPNCADSSSMGSLREALATAIKKMREDAVLWRLMPDDAVVSLFANTIAALARPVEAHAEEGERKVCAVCGKSLPVQWGVLSCEEEGCEEKMNLCLDHDASPIKCYRHSRPPRRGWTARPRGPNPERGAGSHKGRARQTQGI